MATEPRQDAAFSCDLVIARYKESLSWLPAYSKYKFRKVIMYNKGDNDGICPIQGSPCIVKYLKNEGKCDHTYLWHIVNNFDDLADVTVFCKGSSDLVRERKKLPLTVEKAFETRNTVMSVSYHMLPINHALRGFYLNQYTSSHPKNAETGSLLKPADIRPFGSWYEAHFPGVTTNYAVYSGIFAVSRAHIHQHSREYYQRLLSELEGHVNPEVGHYIERSWVAIFNPLPETSLYLDILYEKFKGSVSEDDDRDMKLVPVTEVYGNHTQISRWVAGILGIVAVGAIWLLRDSPPLRLRSK